MSIEWDQDPCLLNEGEYVTFLGGIITRFKTAGYLYSVNVHGWSRYSTATLGEACRLCRDRLHLSVGKALEGHPIRGKVSVTPDFRVEVSSVLRQDVNYDFTVRFYSEYRVGRSPIRTLLETHYFSQRDYDRVGDLVADIIRLFWLRQYSRIECKDASNRSGVKDVTTRLLSPKIDNVCSCKEVPFKERKPRAARRNLRLKL